VDGRKTGAVGSGGGGWRGGAVGGGWGDGFVMLGLELAMLMLEPVCQRW
jgi:hypothetical protein